MAETPQSTHVCCVDVNWKHCGTCTFFLQNGVPCLSTIVHPFLSLPILICGRKSSKIVTSLVQLVKYYFLSLCVRITPGTGSKCGYQKHKANIPLFLKHCDHKSSYYHHLPWGKFALEADTFEKAKRTNVKNMTLSRKKNGNMKK